MLESTYQRKLIKKIQDRYPGAVILKTDPAYIQGFPDWLILNAYNWAALDAKSHEKANHEPNQDYWINVLDDMSFASFVYPENEGEVLDGLQQALRSSRSTRLLKW